MKRLIKTAMAVLLAVMAVSCTSDEEQLVSKSRGTVSVSINGIINGYTPQDATRAVAQNVVRIMWVGGETVYVFEGGKYLGSLTATKGDETGTYAKLSGTIDAPTDGKTLTLVYSPQFTEAPTATGDKISLDLSTQADTYVPFLVYATMPATETTDISSVSVHFDLATSVYKCNCAGLGESGAITQAVIGEVNTVCELTLSADDAPTVSGTTPGNITRKAGFSGADQRAIFSVAVANTNSATGARTIEITRGGKKFNAAFDKGALGTAAAYNTVCVFSEVYETPDGALSGEFTVSATKKKVYFSKGNLYAKKEGDVWKWHFYDKQHQYSSLWTGTSRTAYATDDEIDLFTWGYSASTSLVPNGSNYVYGHTNMNDLLVYDKSSSEGGDDWGVAYCESNGIKVGTWRTLTGDEWSYLINESDRMINDKPCYSNAVKGVSIEGVTYKGIFVYPDNYDGDVVSNSMTWNSINAAGIIFLPAAGFRSSGGTSVGYAGYWGRYCSSSSYSSSTERVLDFSESNVVTNFTNRSDGHSVRLVTDVPAE